MGLRRYRRERLRRLATSIDYHGVDIPLSGTHIAPPIRDQLFDDDYERHEINAAQALIEKGDRILELGTGMGVVTALLSRATGPRGRVLSFEANPHLIAPAAELFRRNSVTNVDAVHGVLVPEEGGTRRFHFAEYFPEGSLRMPNSKLGEIEVPAFNLTEVLSNFRPDILICDIEGAEADLIPAFDVTGLRAAVIELHPHRLSDVEIKAIYDRLIEAGLYPRIEFSAGTVVAFERLQTP